MITVSGLYTYPIKSCAGTRLDSVALTATGLEHDRTLMLIHEDGKFVTQREVPELCLIRPRIVGHESHVTASGSDDLIFTPNRIGEPVGTSVWGDDVQAVAQESAVNEWFSDFLKTNVRLVAMHESFKRQVDAAFAEPKDIVEFADGLAVLLISEASLADLNAKLDAPVAMDRFRPNIVITGCEPHAEDFWKEIAIGDISMSGVKPCARCSMVAVDQASGNRGVEPTKTLAEYRRFQNGVMFGMNMVHHGIGTISIGDTLTPTEWHEPNWITSPM
ncbi:MAG: MOSC domain-containing protein [Planctomycetaceae bacterium]